MAPLSLVFCAVALPVAGAFVVNPASSVVARQTAGDLRGGCLDWWTRIALYLEHGFYSSTVLFRTRPNSCRKSMPTAHWTSASSAHHETIYACAIVCYLATAFRMLVPLIVFSVGTSFLYVRLEKSCNVWFGKFPRSKGCVNPVIRLEG